MSASLSPEPVSMESTSSPLLRPISIEITVSDVPEFDMLLLEDEISEPILATEMTRVLLSVLYVFRLVFRMDIMIQVEMIRKEKGQEVKRTEQPLVDQASDKLVNSEEVQVLELGISKRKVDAQRGQLEGRRLGKISEICHFICQWVENLSRDSDKVAERYMFVAGFLDYYGG
ncbi:hypothetical protein L873DRAFT_1805856 [Choiromyces venosus 120613-1]|uniref:Uncharacterized protein n=1 Tax=Choiromyces venosus 120613-1 TaxID=1336337 RepID=A0A3N4K2F7_9PEZI|nr:hypothetical protein L873DRAFT_1805856 [Choiromyces venosus 120613-1]